jgi:hypothetical protein
MTEKNSKRLAGEIDSFQTDNPDIKQVEVLATDICGHFFGKRYPISRLATFAQEGLAMPASMFVLNTLGEPLEGIRYGVDDGDPDAHFYLVPGSLCLAALRAAAGNRRLRRQGLAPHGCLRTRVLPVRRAT